jgi:hypothetical protein
MVVVKGFMRPTRRRLLIAAGVFTFVFLFVPLIKCQDNVETGKSTCQDMKLCSTDYYGSLAKMILSSDGIVCPAREVTTFRLVDLTLLLAALCYLLACGIDSLYIRYRDL